MTSLTRKGSFRARPRRGGPVRQLRASCGKGQILNKIKIIKVVICSADFERSQLFHPHKERLPKRSVRKAPASKSRSAGAAGFSPSFGAVTHRFRTSGTLSPPPFVRSLVRGGRITCRWVGSAPPSPPPPYTMGHHFQVDFFKSSLRILFTHVLLLLLLLL